MKALEVTIEKLYKAIEEESEKMLKYNHLFGADDPTTEHAIYMLMGMEAAFKIVAGKSTSEYLLEQYDA